VEIWKDVVGYEGLYQVSNIGRVKSCDRIVSAGDNNHEYQHIKEKILNCKSYGKYVQVVLSKEGKVKCFGVHRLVAQAFIPNPYNLPCVNHKDTVKTNNRVNNLEWCTYKYNNEYDDRVEKCKSKISTTLKGRPLSFKWTSEQKKHISEGVKKSWIIRKQSAIMEEIPV